MDENLDLSKDTEINKALKEFEIENVEAAAQNAPVASQKDERLGLVGWVVKHSGGLIKDERQAEYVILGLALAAIIISLFPFFKRAALKVEPDPATVDLLESSS